MRLVPIYGRRFQLDDMLYAMGMHPAGILSSSDEWIDQTWIPNSICQTDGTLLYGERNQCNKNQVGVCNVPCYMCLLSHHTQYAVPSNQLYVLSKLLMHFTWKCLEGRVTGLEHSRILDFNCVTQDLIKQWNFPVIFVLYINLCFENKFIRIGLRPTLVGPLKLRDSYPRFQVVHIKII